MPYVVAFNRPAIEERLTRLARYLGLPSPGFQAVLDWVLALRKEIGIPDTLADLGVKEADLDMLVPMAVGDTSPPGKPRPPGHAQIPPKFIKASRACPTLQAFL